MTMIPQNQPQKPLRIAIPFLMVVVLSVVAFATTPSVSYAAFPGTNGKIAFESTRDSSFGQIYAMNADGTGVTRLTFTSAHDSYPVWSPDSTKILFESTRSGDVDIYVMNADGTNQTQLTSDPAVDNQATWSPDGAKIIFGSRRSGTEDIYIMNADGTGQTQLTTDPAIDTAPDWSPDGTKIAFESDRGGSRQIFVMNADGTNITQLTTLSNNGGAAWSPDGTKIIFHSDRHCGGCNTYPDIYIMNADGTGQTRLAFDPAYATGPAWSPDGTKIVFDSQRDGDYEVYVMNVDGTGQTNLTNHPAVDFRANWGPQPVTYNFTGFFQPVDNLPTFNTVNAGQAIPVKFRLGGDQGLNIFAAGYPKSQQIACDLTATVDGIEQTVTAGSSSLSYDASTDTYTYVWKTEKAWAGTCRQLVVKLNDGTSHRASFKFK
jgi:Tol biopolymer transport system component